jgi:hypothetical protein
MGDVAPGILNDFSGEGLLAKATGGSRGPFGSGVFFAARGKKIE